jgi:adenine-specific DNA-methyltransferase
VRYIGNKTRLLGFIRRVIRARGIAPGHAVDPFTGTASVARALKRWNFTVTASDIMQYGYVFARAYVQTAGEPDFTAVGDIIGCERPTRRQVLAWLARSAPQPGFLHEHYSPAGSAGAEHGRMYFTPDSAARIDHARTTIELWRASGLISDDAFHLLLAAIIEGADRIANTTGVYAAFVKTWQPNALRTFQLKAVPLVAGSGSSAACDDAVEVVRAAGPFDLLYLDPPYNARQYAGYYHIPELLATGWFGGAIETRGKTGLIYDSSKRSDWSSSRRCASAFEELLATADCRHIMLSYSEEGLISETRIERLLKQYGIRATYRRYRRSYRRYRSGTDNEEKGSSRHNVAEYIYCVAR